MHERLAAYPEVKAPGWLAKWDHAASAEDAFRRSQLPERYDARVWWPYSYGSTGTSEEVRDVWAVHVPTKTYWRLGTAVSATSEADLIAFVVSLNDEWWETYE